MDENDSADRIFNADETGLSTDPNKRTLLFKKSLRDSYILTPISSKSMHMVDGRGRGGGLKSSAKMCRCHKGMVSNRCMDSIEQFEMELQDEKQIY